MNLSHSCQTGSPGSTNAPEWFYLGEWFILIGIGTGLIWRLLSTQEFLGTRALSYLVFSLANWCRWTTFSTAFLRPNALFFFQINSQCFEKWYDNTVQYSLNFWLISCMLKNIFFLNLKFLFLCRVCVVTSMWKRNFMKQSSDFHEDNFGQAKLIQTKSIWPSSDFWLLLHDKSQIACVHCCWETTFLFLNSFVSQFPCKRNLIT